MCAQWVDAIYGSSNATWDAADILLGQFEHSGSLLPGESYTAQQQVVLPDGISATYYVLVKTDDTSRITETGAENNNVALVATDVTLAPYADLVVSQAAATAGIVIGSPAQIDVSWTVSNQGTGAGPATNWRDRIVISTNGIYGDSDDKFVAEFDHTGALAAGGTYSRSERVSLPSGLSGSYVLFVATDVTNIVYEYTFENNNYKPALDPVRVHPMPYADLVIATVTGPPTATSEQQISLTWTVANQGIGITSINFWKDQLLLSSDLVIGNSDDIALGSVFRSGALEAGASYTKTLPVVLPRGIEGNYYAFVVTDAANAVNEFLFETNNAGHDDAPIAISLTPPPDLQVPLVSVPSEGRATESIVVTWQVTNDGPGSARGSWVDRVYLSSDQQIGNDTLLGSFTRTEDLPSGVAYGRTEAVTLPDVAAGSYYVLVVTDAQNTVYEHTQENNNHRTAPTTLLARRSADLVVDAVSHAGTGISGQNLDVAWRVRNQGIVTTSSSVWQDRVFLSTDSALDGSDTVLGTVTHYGGLQVDGDYTGYASVTLPDRVEGDFYLLVQADVGGSVYEGTFENNNTAASIDRLSVEPGPRPDLHIADLQSPTTGRANDRVLVGWTVENSGATRATAPWTTQVYLSPSGTLAGATLMATRQHSGNLNAGAAYEDSVEVILPAWSDGSYRFVVVVDTGDTVYEGDGEGNNSLAASNPLILTHPNLVAMIMDSPQWLVSGTTGSVTWSVENNGTAATPDTWWDRVYLSLNQHVEPGQDILLAQREHVGSLAPSDDYTVQLAFTVPVHVSGDWYILVRTDDAGQVVEVADEGDNTSSRPIQVALAPYPDLVVSEVTGPSLTIGDPGQVTVGWTVTNLGIGAGNVDTWMDRVIASTDTIVGNGDDRLLAEFVHHGKLEVGDSYSAVRTFLLPPALQGRFRLFVRADSTGLVFENAEETNNAAETGHVFDVMPIPVRRSRGITGCSFCPSQ